MSAWPSIFCTDLRSRPPSRRCVAKECLMLCGVNLSTPPDYRVSSRPAEPSALSIGIAPAGQIQERRLRPLSKEGLNSQHITFLSCWQPACSSALSVPSLPCLRPGRNPASKFRSLILMDMISLTLSPEEYISSSIAASRTYSFTLYLGLKESLDIIEAERLGKAYPTVWGFRRVSGRVLRNDLFGNHVTGKTFHRRDETADTRGRVIRRL